MKEFCQLQSLKLVIFSDPTVDDALELGNFFDPTVDDALELGTSSNATEDDALVMRQLIEPGSSLKSLVFRGFPIHIIPILLGQSSLDELTIHSNYYRNFDLLPQQNTNLKKLVLTCDLFPLAILLPNYTSLTCLIINKEVREDELPVLTDLIRSHPTLEVLGIESYYTYYGMSGTADLSLLQLVETAANSRLKQLLFSRQVYNLIPLDIQEQYKHVLGELP